MLFKYIVTIAILSGLAQSASLGLECFSEPGQAFAVVQGTCDSALACSRKFNGGDGLYKCRWAQGGRFDAASDEVDANVSEDRLVHILMTAFFLIASILMMNFLITLINVAYGKGEDSWRLVWLESRLRWIETAENLSYRIPGFRRNYDLFPEQIYFTATEEDQGAYLRKYPKRRRDDALFSKTVNTGEEDQMEGVLRQTPESLQQALELQTKTEANQKQMQESQQQALELQRHEFQRQMEANQQQMQALIDRVILSDVVNTGIGVVFFVDVVV
ncbi:MAG: hypothetical protein J3R72DRAFT_526033 [Linnemannia gamsii]|nr:MAG: hypothetical protein J3R72DRAFT_526033 [Linnemannia gamsii]